ncbi:MAG TPA: transglycosylase domain-containing protein [Dehalococcoidia bacterium]|nr:transglycosylase domain-containing protein [Dehalococcoidia bacterium]
MRNIYRYRRKRTRLARAHSGHVTRARLSALLTLLMFASVVAIVAFAGVAFAVYRSYAHDLKPPEDAIAASTIGTSLVYDRSGQTKLYEFTDEFGGLKDPKPLTELSPWLIAATVSTEDASFYGNPGVNFRGLARAAIENLTPFGPGFLEGSGGSSITQQLVKNVYVPREERGARRVERKIKESVIALELKRKYDDDQILEWYLNQIYFGNFAYGAQAASQRYFAKNAKDLTLGEAALLAGLPQAPGDYTPAILENRELAKQRQIQVLDLMKASLDEVNKIPNPALRGTPDEGKPLFQPPLTADVIEAEKAAPLNYVTTEIDIKTPHFVFFVEDQLAKMCAAGLFKAPGGLPCDKVVKQGGLRVTTTIDLGLQAVGEAIVEEEIARNEARYGGYDGSLIAIRPATGEILTYVGSRNYDRDDIAGKVDIATSAQSHGSTMKVFTYLTAFQQGWVPSSNVDDKKLLLPTAEGEKQVNNWNFSHLGTITMRKAIAESVNTAAVRTVMDAGIDEMRNTAHRLGITDLRQGDCGPTITLGACEVKLVDMTYAFSVLANNGVMKGRPVSEDLPSGYRELDPVSVLKIQDAEGNVIYQYAEPQAKQVIDPAYAYMMTHVLSRDAIDWSRLTGDRPAAAKTGTSEEFRDGVVMGYTPDLSVGVWMGNADNTPMAPGTFSSAGTGPMWRRFLKEAHAYLQLPPRPFEKPENVVTSSCSGREEVFKVDTPVTKPGACKAPGRPGAPTPVSTPRPPVFPPRTPEPTPSPAATPPQETPASSPAPTAFQYTVQEGDTVASIAQKFGISERDLRQANNFKPNDGVKPGDVLTIPPPP